MLCDSLFCCGNIAYFIYFIQYIFYAPYCSFWHSLCYTSTLHLTPTPNVGSIISIWMGAATINQLPNTIAKASSSSLDRSLLHHIPWCCTVLSNMKSVRKIGTDKLFFNYTWTDTPKWVSCDFFFVCVWLYYQSVNSLIYTTIFSGLLQWLWANYEYNCPNASDTSLKNVGESCESTRTGDITTSIAAAVSSMSHRASLATTSGIHLWNCWNVVCIECIILYSSGNKITTTTIAKPSVISYT